MGTFKNLEGMTYGKFKVISRHDHDGKCDGSRVKWLCVCECGISEVVSSWSLRRGIRSGCTKCVLIRHKIKPGDRFGKLVAKSVVSTNGGITKWQCVCDCGRVADIFTCVLRHKSRPQTTCGKPGCPYRTRKPHRCKNLIGERFGKLVIESSAGIIKVNHYNRKQEPMWNCICDCGNRGVYSTRSLAQRRSCGCLKVNHLRVLAKTQKLTDSEREFNRLLSRYKCSARKRGYGWYLTDADVKEITSSNCAYCGSPPQKTKREGVVNGIDREDNDIGYTYENCKPCCRVCNWMKGAMPMKVFAGYVNRIALRQAVS